MKTFPKKKALLFGEGEFEPKNQIQKFDLIFMPPSEIEKLPQNYIDLFINTFSLGEMKKNTAENYLKYITKCAKLFFHINQHTVPNKFSDGSKGLLAYEYKIHPDKFKLLSCSPYVGDIFDQIKIFEDKSKIQDDIWHKKELGNGNSVVIDDGNFFDKAGINFSSISGKSLPESSVGNKSKSMGLPFFATGVSVVFHPKNPHIPTAHLNVRYFCTYKKNQVFEEWFGGGFDLTPYILDEEDCKRWHKGAKDVCGLVDDNFYKVSKKNCDDYFYIPHRKEHRGIGGIFYE